MVADPPGMNVRYRCRGDYGIIMAVRKGGTD
jgi:hypothetical protein